MGKDEAKRAAQLEIRLSASGYSCVWAHSAEEGLAKAAELNPDLIILDLVLPKMSGFGFMSAARDRKELADIPVIVLTALVDQEVAQASKKLGALAYLNTLCKPHDLLKTIAKHMH